MNSTLQHLQQQQQQQQQQHHHQRLKRLEKLKGETRTVQSGKVYRQLFEAQVQLSEAYDRVKDKYNENPSEVKVNEDQIPLIREGRNVRGKGFLTQEAEKWLNAQSNEQYIENPIFYKHKFEENKPKLSSIKKKAEREDVVILPDTVVPASKGSDIEFRIKESRKIKHYEAWEDMIQEISIVNLNKEPEIRRVGKNLLVATQEDDQELESLLNELRDETTILNGCSVMFEEFKTRLLVHTDIRRDYIEQMDSSFLTIENDRVDTIRRIFQEYSDELFKISYLPRPQIEKQFDQEIQQLNNQILMNKSCYAQLYAKLVTSDIEREKNQVKQIEERFLEWRSYALNKEITSLDQFVNDLNMVDSKSDNISFEEQLQKEQIQVNENRLGLIEALTKFKPPESTKTAVYKWNDSVREYSKRIDEINTNYVNRIQISYEDSNQKIINRMEEALLFLIENKIIEPTESKEILEQKLLPIWSKKQRQIEEYIEIVESDFEEISQIVDKELNILFKYLQGITHIWDMHEIGLVKKERALQELLQDCRKDHDHDNQKREEKLDSILDQMRESSSEKDLKRLLSNVSIQLEAIKRGYLVFKDSQLDLVKQYPQMVKEELQKYQENVFKFFSIQSDSSKIVEDNEAEDAEVNKIEKNQKSPDQPAVDSMRFILKEILSTDRGTKFYVTMRSPLDNSQQGNTNTYSLERNKNDSKQSIDENDDLLAFDELMPKKESINIDSKLYLKNAFISMDILKEIKNSVRLNFLNHLESWLEEANERSGSIVAAKTSEIEKELELRVHLHEPRGKRAEMDVHNVRASELIIHEERVERHCAGVDEAIENIKKQFNSIQSKLNDMATQNKSDILNYEMAFMSATKSMRLATLQEQLLHQRDKHMENIKTSLRNFRSKFDETLSYLRNSNAKFRFSFNIFSDGGNFSSEEIEVHKKKLEKMATLIDSNETMLLKDMERLEKKHLDEAVRLMTQFQDKFKYHLVDLQFIEKISRWLNDTQIKIKSEVSASNTQAKQLNKMISDFETRIDACRKPNLDKIKTSPKDLIDFFDQINQAIYDRASYLKCYKDYNVVPLHFRSLQEQFEDKSTLSLQANLAGSISSNRQSITTNINLGVAGVAESTHSASSIGHRSNRSVHISTNNVLANKSNSKLNSEDPALTIIKNLLHTNIKVIEKEPSEILIQKSQSSINQRTNTPSNKGSKNAKITTSRRAKTRDEMYAFYCVFGEQRHPDDDFKSNVNNVLRDALEGILTNSEIFYRDIQSQNRHVTRPQSIKDSYAEFAEAMVQKLKSYFNQCDTYHNQCMKDFRDSLIKFEVLCANVPELVIHDIFKRNSSALHSDLEQLKKRNMEHLDRLEQEKNSNESMLKPNLGHPNMQPKLEHLNKMEQKRQEAYLNNMNEFINDLKNTINKNAENYFKDLAKSNEFLLIKFDDILTEDDIVKHEIIAEKHATSELLKRQKAGLSLEDPEPEPLIRREKGRWNGIENFDYILTNDDNRRQGPFASATINTAKTTLAHQKSTEFIHEFHQKYKVLLEEDLDYVKVTANELSYKSNKWNSFWSNSIDQIKQLYIN